MHRERQGIGAADRFVSVTTLSFDIAGLEIHGPADRGRPRGAGLARDRARWCAPGRLARFERRDLAAGHAPATLAGAPRERWQGRAGLKMLCGGEGLPRDLVDRLLGLGGELWNMYGPTETTIWSWTLWRVTDTKRAISIGRPSPTPRSTCSSLLACRAPIGVAGELCIGGDGLARGYRHRDDLTAEKFVTIELPGLGPRRVYRTGDLVRFLDDGRLEFVGRRDHQVKVRGFRIELGEIETVLATHPGLRESVVHVREDTPGDQRLVGYVVPAEGLAFDAESARNTLRAKLPEYMIPNQFVVLDALPLTPNGKVDRKALPAPQTPTNAVDDAASDALMTPLQREVGGAVVRGVARRSRAPGCQLLDIGGHSLLLVKLQAALQRKFARELPLVELFQRTTVAAQAERLAAPTVPNAALQRAHANARARQVTADPTTT